MIDSVKVVPISLDNVFDRLGLCWGHLVDWKNSRIVERSKEWLEEANIVFTPTTFIAYVEGSPVGMIESIPQSLMRKLGLCPCRADKERGETEDRYLLGKSFEDYLFISCLYVNKDHQGRGVGKALLKRLLNSQAFKESDGALVYVAKRDETWDKYIHWPAGPAEFYLKAGFAIEKTLINPTGHILSYRNG